MLNLFPRLTEISNLKRQKRLKNVSLLRPENIAVLHGVETRRKDQELLPLKLYAKMRQVKKTTSVVLISRRQQSEKETEVLQHVVLYSAVT